PGGYEAALAAARFDADVTLIERVGVGGSAVLTDVVPSKTLIGTAEAVRSIQNAAALGVKTYAVGENGRPSRSAVAVDLMAVNQRTKRLAEQQSGDIQEQLRASGVRIVQG